MTPAGGVSNGYLSACDDEAAYLKALGKTAEVDQLRRLLAHTREVCTELNDWLQGNIQRVIEVSAVWPQLLLVCRYFLANPRRDVYARELPIAVDTKFLERHEASRKNMPNGTSRLERVLIYGRMRGPRPSRSRWIMSSRSSIEGSEYSMV